MKEAWSEFKNDWVDLTFIQKIANIFLGIELVLMFISIPVVLCFGIIPAMICLAPLIFHVIVTILVFPFPKISVALFGADVWENVRKIKTL